MSKQDELLEIDQFFMNLALKEAKKSLVFHDVPVGAVIVSDGRIIGRGYNKVEKKSSSLKHAELIAIEAAIKSLKYKHLLDCTLYVTLEPCPMCAGAAVLARIKRIVYGAEDPKSGACRSLFSITEDARLNHQIEIIPGVLKHECSQLLKDFFKELRSEKNGVKKRTGT